MIKKYIGARMRELRKNQELTQEQLALKANLDRTYIASVEAGKRNISIVNLEKVIEALETDFVTFFEYYKKGEV